MKATSAVPEMIDAYIAAGAVDVRARLERSRQPVRCALGRAAGRSRQGTSLLEVPAGALMSGT